MSVIMNLKIITHPFMLPLTYPCPILIASLALWLNWINGNVTQRRKKCSCFEQGMPDLTAPRNSTTSYSVSEASSTCMMRNLPESSSFFSWHWICCQTWFGTSDPVKLPTNQWSAGLSELELSSELIELGLPLPPPPPK